MAPPLAPVLAFLEPPLWSYKTCEAPVKFHHQQTPSFLQAGYALPVVQPTVSEQYEHVDEQMEKGDVLVNAVQPGDGGAAMAVLSASSAAVQSADTTDQTGVVVASSSPYTGSATPAARYQSNNNTADLPPAGYVPLPQLFDHISPYTAVDTA